MSGFFSQALSGAALEEGVALSPRFDAHGLITAVATDAESGDVLMVAHMNAQALQRTIETGQAHYWSRSRGELWHKGATSGQIQRLVELRIDCDQDAVWLKVRQQGGGCCHVGYPLCFYRIVRLENGQVKLITDQKKIS
jgi:phosphoribosyl-AMP cyclohydrolase